MKKEKININVLSPTVPEPGSMTKEDVWGKFDDEKKIDNGMIVAVSDETCPHFKDKVPFKSVTVVCLPEQEQEVTYWLEYVHGGGSVQETKEFTEGDKLMCAIRSDYQCW